MSTAIAIFAKTIGISPVKTRLAKGIGKEKAEEFYNHSVVAIEETIIDLKSQSQEEIVPYWALAEEEGILNRRWKTFKSLWTGEGDLGQRLYHISKELLKKHEKLVIIGTDSPQIEAKIIVEAIGKLDKHPQDCIIGPAFDGGFYLFACNNLISKEIWTSVTYSKEDTLNQLLWQLKQNNIGYSFLKKLSDVDEIDDLKELDKSLNSIKENINSSQKKIKLWLEQMLDKKDSRT